MWYMKRAGAYFPVLDLYKLWEYKVFDCNRTWSFLITGSSFNLLLAVIISSSYLELIKKHSIYVGELLL